ncbi:conserved Plasmodium protein, unknown function [Plasmodium ovale wallikeri]|uniref:PIR Superfamily Protein n=1 Tax=Plasmodium ovale wallikeri TaxID=864142 RepID=A0A1A8ZVG6_PLAOA|nr:conserved Plasmodium protein, unknown function [Plasmodium ovale wallikeri]SBT48338.1 conserved Plasmodium protein, unknown function [Plasmodium ovale wallikeri]
MLSIFFIFLSFFCFLIQRAPCDIIIVDSNEVLQSFDKDTVLNLSEKVFNIFLDTKTKNIDIKGTYADIFNKSKVTINGTCADIKELIKGRSLKYLDIIPGIYKKHPNYISYIITCKESDIFDNPEDAKENKNVFHTNPVILSQLMIVFLIFFFLFIGFYVLVNISTPKIYEERQLVINKEH